MSKELNFQGGNDVLKYQDDTSQLHLYISENGQPFDLSRLDSAVIKFGNSNGFVTEKPIDFSKISDLKSGLINVYLSGSVMDKLKPGNYNIEVWGQLNPVDYVSEANDVTISIPNGLDDKQIIFPSDGELTITIDENIKASDTDAINAYAIDDIYDELNKWKNQTVNSISSSLSSQLLDDIKHWQGGISEDLKNELLQDLGNDENSIQEKLNKLLTDSLDDLINKEVAEAKNNIHNDLHDELSNNIEQQVANIKSQISEQFNLENSSMRSNLEDMVKKGIQDEINDTLQEMQKNGDIYATKEEFNDFVNSINEKIKEINISDVLNQANTYTDNKVKEVNDDLKSSINDINKDVLKSFDMIKNLNAITHKGNVPNGFDLNSNDVINNEKNVVYYLSGVRPLGVPDDLENLWGSILLLGKSVQTQIIINDKIFYRIATPDWKNDWKLVTDNNDLQSAISNVANTLNNKVDKKDFQKLSNSSFKYQWNLSDDDDVFDLGNPATGVNGIYELSASNAKNLPHSDFTGKFIKLGNGTGNSWNEGALFCIDEVSGAIYYNHIWGWPYSYGDWEVLNNHVYPPLPKVQPQDYPKGVYIADGNPNQWGLPSGSWLNIVKVDFFKSWSGANIRFIQVINGSNEEYHWISNQVNGSINTGWRKII